LEAEGVRLRCDLGCGPEGPVILDGMLGVGDSLRVWFQKPDIPRTGVGWRVATVRLHGNPRTFTRADSRLTQGQYRTQRAFSHGRSMTAHILPEEVPRPERWMRFGPGVSGPRLAIHEVTHLMIYQMAVNPRWPAWVSEGIAGVSEEMWVRAGWGSDPWLDTRDHVRRVLLAQGRLPGWDEIMDESPEPLAVASRYAVWAGFMAVLLSEPFRSATLEALSVLASASPRDGWNADAVRGVFEAHFSAEDRRAVDGVFQARVRDQTPVWAEYHRGSQETAEGLLQVAGDGRLALLWRLPETPELSDPACLWATGTFNGPESAGLLLLLGQDEGTAHGVVILADREPALVALPLGAESPDDVLMAQVGPLDGGASPEEDSVLRPGPGEPFAFLVRRAGNQLSLTAGDDSRWVVEIPVAGLGAGWGIGTLGSAEVVWTELAGTCRGPGIR